MQSKAGGEMKRPLGLVFATQPAVRLGAAAPANRTYRPGGSLCCMWREVAGVEHEHH